MSKLVTISKDTFWAVIMGERAISVHPRPERDEIVWSVTNTREQIGRETPGYLCEGPKSWAMTERWLDRYVAADLITKYRMPDGTVGYCLPGDMPEKATAS